MPDSATAIGPEAQVTLRPITDETLRAILHLKVAEAQQQFVASNAVSVAQAHFSRNAWFRAIYADETPVGFLMIHDDPIKGEYFLWRLMIDARHQGHGFGRRAVELLVDHVKTRPKASALLVSHGEGEGDPGPFYRKLGFTYTGDVLGGELVMRLPLEIAAQEPVAADEGPPADQPLVHVVLFKLKDRSPENIAETVAVLRSMAGKIATLQGIEAGDNVVPSDRAYDIALITRFDSLANMETYQVHPVHQGVAAHMRTVSESAAAVDFLAWDGDN